jgi:hypothetical protein
LAACPHGSQVEYETLPQERYCQRDDWGISVGGSGMDGSYLQTNTVFPQLTNTFSFSSGGTDGGFSASFGNDMDLIALATVGLIMTTISQDNFTSNICHENDPAFQLYNCFNGTSAAAPHVVGSSALLMEHYEGITLSVEDIEHLIEYSATDIVDLTNPGGFIYDEGYDQFNGWGRLNAEKALELIDINHDNYKIVHVDINGANISSPPDCTPDPFDCDDDYTFWANFLYGFQDPLSGVSFTETDINGVQYLIYRKTHTAPALISVAND